MPEAKAGKVKFPTSFGVFSPTGHVVMVFGSDADATQARQALVRGGCNDTEIVQYDKNEVLGEFQRSEKHSEDPLQIGQEVDKVDRYLEFAKAGSGFLVAHVPDDAQAKRMVELARPFRLKFAEKYNRLTIEELA